MSMFGQVRKFGDDINTDYIIAGKYRSLSGDMAKMATKIFADLDPDFYQKIQPGDFIVGGENFGCGSSREYAPRVILESGLKAVLAKSFARIFYRNSINIGLPVIICNTDGIEAGDQLEIDLELGVIRNLDKGTEEKITPYPAIINTILSKGGLLEYLKSDNFS